MNRLKLWLVKSLPLLLLASACAGAEPPTAVPEPDEPNTQSAVFNGPISHAASTLPSDGNRLVAGSGNTPTLTPLDIALDGVPEWVTAVAYQNGALWVIVLENGQVQGFMVANGSATPTPVMPQQIPAGAPPLFVIANGAPQIVQPENASPQTHPVLLNDGGDLAYIATTGNLIIRRGDSETTLPVNAQPDARILTDDRGRLLLNSDPTDRYAHGIMGDALEAASLTLVETQPEPRIVRTIPIGEAWVMESMAPLWVDLDNDGAREIVVTRSNASQGAQLALLNEQGELLATGPAIGNGNRWRHALAVAPFAPDGSLELVEVRTPHIGGPTNFYRWQAERLEIVTNTSGYTSHVIGSRNLDMAVAGRFDDSGRFTLILPTQKRDALGGIQHGDSGAEVVWQLPLPGRLVTNMAAVALADGRLALGAGLENGTLRIWQP